MKKFFLTIISLFYLTNVYPQIEINIKHIEKDNTLLLDITNVDTDTILIADSYLNRLSMVKISLYPKDNSEPYEDWCTLGTDPHHGILPVIELEPNGSYSHTYRQLTFWEKGPYSKIEVYYEIFYKHGSLKKSNFARNFDIIRGRKTLYK